MKETPSVSVPQETTTPYETMAGTRCAFCLEGIKPGASVCPHCGRVLAPFQRLHDNQATIEARLGTLEQEVAALRATLTDASPPADIAPKATSVHFPGTTFGWPHMADNLFLGLTALLAAHWLATTLPLTNRAVYRLAALAVAMPFGFRFETYAHTTTSVKVLAALAFGGLGTVVVGSLDVALAGDMPAGIGVQDLVASVAAIALSHLAGSFLAGSRRRTAQGRATAAPDAGASLHFTPAAVASRQILPDKIKDQAAAVKAVTEAVAALVAAAAALWAAFRHVLS